MRQNVLLDTGPLVAYLKRQDLFHDWAVEQWEDIKSPLLTCEAVIVEACFLLRNTYKGQETVISLLDTKAIAIPFCLHKEAVALSKLLNRYQSVPISLADACLVRMSELYAASVLLTLDSDFLIYRKNGNQTIPVIMPNR
jgi:uncharacterized protein